MEKHRDSLVMEMLLYSIPECLRSLTFCLLEGGSATPRYKRTDPANIVLREDLAVDRVIIGDKPFYKNAEIL